MVSDDIKKLIEKGPLLARDIDKTIPQSNSNSALRADLAGLLIISIAASYESCVKETFFTYSSKHNDRFAFFIEKNFDKLNSKITLDDLNRYAKTFGDSISKRFQDNLKKNKRTISDINGQNIEQCYKTLLQWRHAFAHAGERKATINEALKAHNYARLVIYSFYMAFNED